MDAAVIEELSHGPLGRAPYKSDGGHLDRYLGWNREECEPTEPAEEEDEEEEEEYNGEGDGHEFGNYRRWAPDQGGKGVPEAGAVHIPDAEYINQHDFEEAAREADPRLMEAAPDLSGPSSSRPGSTLTAERRSLMMDMRGSLRGISEKQDIQHTMILEVGNRVDAEAAARQKEVNDLRDMMKKMKLQTEEAQRALPTAPSPPSSGPMATTWCGSQAAAEADAARQARAQAQKVAATAEAPSARGITGREL